MINATIGAIFVIFFMLAGLIFMVVVALTWEDDGIDDTEAHNRYKIRAGSKKT